MGNGFCHLVTRDYVPFAQRLVRQLAAVEPSTSSHVFVLDAEQAELPPEFIGRDTLREFFDFAPWAEFYAPFELCNALRPVALRFLFERRGLSKAIYLDADVHVVGAFTEAWRLLDDKSFVLTPHTMRPYPDPRRGDLNLLQFGLHNFGFLGFRADSAARNVLRFLQERLACFAFFDPPHLHGGQEVLDLAAYFYRRDFAPVEHPGYNVAFWNLHERRITADAGGYRVNGEPLVFFHFSGFDFTKPTQLTRHDRGGGEAATAPALESLARDYSGGVLAAYAGQPLPSPVYRLSDEEKERRRQRFCLQHGLAREVVEKKRWADGKVFRTVLSKEGP